MAASRPTTDLARDLACRFLQQILARRYRYPRSEESISPVAVHGYWRTRWNEIPSEELKEDLYCRVGHHGKDVDSSVVVFGQSIIWSVYRRDEFFSQDEFDLFRETSDVISAAIVKHLGLVELSFPSNCDGYASRSNLLSSLERRAPRLSGREWEVCEGIARGKDNEDIAEELGIKFSSVLTYKKRIYEKLGVST